MFQQADWIGNSVNMGETCPEFLRELNINGGVEKALLYITAIGIYEARLDGERIGDFVMAPGCTVYRERLQYQEYNITGLLRDKRQGCLTVTVGSGWHRGRISVDSPDIHDMPAALIAQLEIIYEDGRQETIITDENWKVRRSRFLQADIYDGETYDASAPEEQESPVKVLKDLSKERLIPQEGEIVCEHERIKPRRCLKTPAGEWIIDFGQNLAGYVEFQVKAKKGDRIVISHGEILDGSGNLYTENYRTAQAKLTYICREGEQTWKPRLVFYGFRYIRIDEHPENMEKWDITAIALYSHMERTGYIETSHPGINRLFENTLWSQRSNFIDIPTDCPQRDERMGWTGDAQVFCRTASYNYNVKKFFSKWLADVRAEQFEDGMISDVVPNFWRWRKGSTGWGDVITIAPWQMYLTYGDSQVLADNFDAMKRWVDYMTSDSKDKYLWTCDGDEKKLWGKHYGDWLAQDAPYGSYIGATNIDFISSAFYSYSVALLVKAGKVLGKDMTEYEELHRNIVRTFRKTFPERKTQTAYVLALKFGLSEDPATEAAELVQMIRENGKRLQTGFLGTPYLLHVLSENGYESVAYDLLLQEAFPSWLYEVNHGATTIWEHWDGIRDDGTIWSKDMNSYNHYAYGCVMDWIYGVAAGIQPVEEHPGFERVRIAPMPDKRLGWLKVTLRTAYGTIRSGWVWQKDGVDDVVRYEIEVPVSASIIIDGKEHLVEAGKHVFWGSENCIFRGNVLY